MMLFLRLASFARYNIVKHCFDFQGGPRSSLGNERPSLDGDHDPHFEPIITLPEVKIPTLEEEETVLHRA